MRKIIKKCIIILTLFSLFLQESSIAVNAAVSTDSDISINISSALEFLAECQKDDGSWIISSINSSADIANIIEFTESCECLGDKDDMVVDTIINGCIEYYWHSFYTNVDNLSGYLSIKELRADDAILSLLIAQNPDGGFGLSDGYASDIIDTKLAMKALADVGETEAMNKAAKYIASLQNDDGGFSYQQGLESDPGLSAEIADVYGDCIIADQSIASDFSDTLNALETYLDENLPSLDSLSADSMAEVYQHFYTALFKLKKGEKVNVSSYYTLQTEDGGVFDDPLATALFLEMIVREQNSLTAGIDHISITNDKGYSVSSFNADENVHIDVASDYETEKAYQKITVETPSGETIDIDADNPVWNTADSGCHGDGSC